MSSAHDERRSHTRHEVGGVRGTFMFTTDARVLNMSLDGMSIETSNPLKIGRAYTLKVEDDGLHLPLRGKVVWCSLVKTSRDDLGEIKPIYRAGVHFEDILSSKARKLKEFILNKSVVGLESRLFGRFRVDPQQAAGLSYEADFLVRQLSLSGMLVETDVAPPVDTRCQMEIRLGEVQFISTVRIVRAEHLRHGIEEENGEPAKTVIHLGIEFIDMDEDTRQSLAAFIQSESTT